MVSIIGFIFFIIDALLGLLLLAIIVSAIMSWLVAFNVVNGRNEFVYQVSRFLDAVTGPVLYPVQRIMPNLGGVDISPIIVILVIQGIRRFLLPPLHASLLQLVGG